MKSGTYRVCVLALASFASIVRADSFNLTRFYSVHAGTPLVETKGPSAEAPDALLLGGGSVSFALSQLPPLKTGFLPVLRANVAVASGKSARLTVEKAGRVLYDKRIGESAEPLTLVLGPIAAEDRLRFAVEAADGAQLLLDYPTIDPMWAIPLQPLPSASGRWTVELGGLLGKSDYRLVTPMKSSAECEVRSHATHREPITGTFTRSHETLARLARGEMGSMDVPLGFFHRAEKLAWNFESTCALTLGTAYLLETGPAKKLGVRLDKSSTDSIADRFSPFNQSGIAWARGGLVRTEDSSRFLALKSKGFQVVLRVRNEAEVRSLAALGKNLEYIEVSDPKLLLALHRVRESGALPAFTSAALVFSSDGAIDSDTARVADVLAVPADGLARAFEKVGRSKPIWIVESGERRLSTARDPLALLESIQSAAQHPMATVTAVILDENETGPETAAPGSAPEHRLLGAYGP